MSVTLFIEFFLHRGVFFKHRTAVGSPLFIKRRGKSCVLDRKHLNTQKSGISGSVHGNSRHGNSGWHLYSGKKRVNTAKPC